jgi:hypothetical protein
MQIKRAVEATRVDWARWGFGGDGRYRRHIDPLEWTRLEAALVAARFWSLEPHELPAGLDGAAWTVEGRRRDVYRPVKRWSPSGALYDLSRAFFDLAGPPIATMRLY